VAGSVEEWVKKHLDVQPVDIKYHENYGHLFK
jgi:hypothetical protein